MSFPDALAPCNASFALSANEAFFCLWREYVAEPRFNMPKDKIEKKIMGPLFGDIGDIGAEWVEWGSAEHFSMQHEHLQRLLHRRNIHLSKHFKSSSDHPGVLPIQAV